MPISSSRCASRGKVCKHSRQLGGAHADGKALGHEDVHQLLDAGHQLCQGGARCARLGCIEGVPLTAHGV